MKCSRKHVAASVLIVVLIVLGAQASPSPTYAATYTIAVNPNVTYQTVRGVSDGNFITRWGDQGINTPYDPVGLYNASNLPLAGGAARVSMELNVWEPANDNSDANSFNWAVYNATAADLTNGAARSMRIASDLKSQRGVSQILASIWAIPSWMGSGSIAEAQWPEAIESMAAWLITARDTYGVTIDYVSFNEPNIGVEVDWAPADLARFMIQAGQRFSALGLSTKWALGDASNITGGLTYSQAVWDNTDVHPYVGVHTFHTWQNSFTDTALAQTRTWAAEQGLDVWATEVGYDSGIWRRAPWATWDHGFNTMVFASRMLKNTGASSIQYWQYLNDYNTNDGTQPYPIFNLLKQFGSVIPTGAQIVDTGANPSGLYAVAAKKGTLFTLHLVVASGGAMTVSGLPNGLYTHRRSSATENDVIVETINVTNGTATLTVGSSTISVLTSGVTQGGSPTGTAAPPTATATGPTATPIATSTPVTSGVMHVASIVMTKQQASNGHWNARAIVTIYDATGASLPGVLVSGTFSGASASTVSGTTDTAGQTTLQSSNNRNGGTWTFCVSGASKSGFTYNSGANLQTCASITAP